METELASHLKSLALKYERAEFLVGDPSWFMHQIEGDTNKELFAFIASSLSYGSRKMFLPKIQMLLDHINSSSNSNVALWLTSHKYEEIIPQSPASFYRLYSYSVFNSFLSALSSMVVCYGSIKRYLKLNMRTDSTTEAIEHITTWFREHDSLGVIPKDTTSSCKRVCMFLRWMVRDSSPVDLGIWADIIKKETLIIPMDTHVVQEALRLGLITSKSTSMSNALKLSKVLSEIFPGDPIKGDFALFGLGVHSA